MPKTLSSGSAALSEANSISGTGELLKTDGKELLTWADLISAIKLILNWIKTPPTRLNIIKTRIKIL